MRKTILIALTLAGSSIVTLAGLVLAKDEPKDALPAGSVSRAEGLQAWKRIEAVVTHPRCANCHVDARAIPIWTPAGESKSRGWFKPASKGACGSRKRRWNS